MKKFSIAICICLFAFTACKKDENETPAPLPKYGNGVFIINEGVFQSGTGTVSFYNKSNNVVEHDLFQQINGIPLGNVAQSLTQYGGRTYIVVNNSNKIEVVGAADFKSVGTIDGLVSPRYMTAVSGSKGYVSGWDNKVSIINLATLQISGYIDAGTGPEKMLLRDDYLFVLNQGGFDIDSTITVINTLTDAVVKTIQVFHKPTGITAQDDGTIWVMCSGRGWNGFPQPGDTPGHLISIDPQSLELETDLVFPDTDYHPEKLVIDKTSNTLYYNYPGGICRHEIGESTPDVTPFISHAGLFYALGYDPKDKVIYASDPLNYNQDGWVYRYRASDAAKIDSIRAGIIPGEFWFVD